MWLLFQNRNDRIIDDKSICVCVSFYSFFLSRWDYLAALHSIKLLFSLEHHFLPLTLFSVSVNWDFVQKNEKTAQNFFFKSSKICRNKWSISLFFWVFFGRFWTKSKATFSFSPLPPSGCAHSILAFYQLVSTIWNLLALWIICRIKKNKWVFNTNWINWANWTLIARLTGQNSSNY